MNRFCSVALRVCLLLIGTASAFASERGTVTVVSPAGSLWSSSVHYVANATTSCRKGVAAMGIYTAPYQRVYTVKGAKLDTVLNLTPGSYDTVVQEWDNCGSSASVHVPISIQVSTTTLISQTTNNTSAANTFV